jgi:hypothetical protein
MGIGVALASGFIRELNQIEKEKRASAAEKARLAQEQATFRSQELYKSTLRMGESKAAAETARNVAAAKSVADTLQEAVKGGYITEEGLANGIGSGATVLKPEWIDLSKTANAMNEVASTFKYGNTRFTKPTEKWDEDLRADNPLRAGGAWLNFFNTYFEDEERGAAFLNDLVSDERAMERFVGDVNKYANYYIDGQLKKPNVDPALLSGYQEPESAYGTLFTFLKNNGVRVGNLQETSDAAIKGAAAEAGVIDNPETAVIFKFTTPKGISKTETFDMEKGQWDSLTRIATTAGYGNNVQGFVNDFTDISRAESGEDAYGILLDAVDFEIAGYSVFNTTGAGTTNDRIRLGRDLRERYGDDPYPGVQALSAIMTVEEDKKALASKRRGYTIKMKPPEDYFTRNKLNRQQVIDQYAASENALGQLQQLDGLIADNETPTGLKAKIQQVGFGIFGEGGQIEQFFADENANGYEDGTTAQSLKNIAVEKGFLSAEAATKLSTIDALKLSLAAQMARAIDPSGRLSNQDFEIQLTRLGQTGLFTAKPQARASLAVVISDFKRQRRRLQILNEVATADTFGIREARLLKADRVARMASNALYVSEQTGQVAPAGEQPEGSQVKPVGVMSLDSSLGIYFDEAGQAFEDAGGTQPLSVEQVMKKMGEST